MLDGLEPAGLVVEVAEIVLHEADQSDLVAHLPDADVLPPQLSGDSERLGQMTI
jgi:hypothetical protein